MVVVTLKVVVAAAVVLSSSDGSNASISHCSIRSSSWWQ